MFEWDEGKSARNKEKHGLSFSEAEAMIGGSGTLAVVQSTTYPGQEIMVFRGPDKKIYVAVTERRGTATRIITVHRSRKMEKQYGP